MCACVCCMLLRSYACGGGVVCVQTTALVAMCARESGVGGVDLCECVLFEWPCVQAAACSHD